MAPRDPRRRRLLTGEERVLWTAVTRSIAPLREGARDTEEVADAAQPQPSPPPPKKRAAKPAPIPQAPPPAPPPAPPLTPLGRRMRARVARGKEAIDARLDLHGLTQSEAHAALFHFVRGGSARGARLVLVITGKGSRNSEARDGGGRGVLRRQVPHWLGLPEFRDFVLGFEDAHVAHGGEGALYVRLRKARRD
jgi:DNA-nicking Smr family endonuclease